LFSCKAQETKKKKLKMNSLILLPLFAAVAAAGILPGHYGAPAAYHGVAPVVAVAPAVYGNSYAQRSQYHSQDGYGQYSYGYAEPNSQKQEARHADGTVTGSYSHALPDGRVLVNNYVADEYGFRSSLAPTAAKDFAPVVKAAYHAEAPVFQHAVQTIVQPQPAIHVAKTINYAAPVAYASAPIAYGYQAAPGYGYGYGAGPAYLH
jgi:hypothetical protein